MGVELFDDALLPALAASILAVLLLLYVWGVVGAYRAAGDGWKTMDRDVRLVFLLVVPLFRGGIKVLLWVDKHFYTPKSEKNSVALAASISAADTVKNALR